MEVPSVDAKIINFPDALVSSTDIKDTLVIGGISTSADGIYQYSLNKFLQQEKAIAGIVQYNYNNLTSPYRIGPIPKTQWEWQYWNMINSKLGKYLER